MTWCSPRRMRRPTGTIAHVPSRGTIKPKGRRIAMLYRLSQPPAEAIDRIPMPDLDAIHTALLALHKAVLGSERAPLERVHGNLSNAAFLQLVSDPVRYG